MKTVYSTFLGLLSILLISSCASYTPYAYDDTYYSPNNDPVKQVQKNPREDFNKTDNIQYDGSYSNRYQEEEKAENYPQSLYSNRYTEAERTENNQAQTQTQAEDVEYYDEEYAQTLQTINSPVRSFNTYDPYQRDRILYTYDPFFSAPTLYGNYAFWDPFVPRTNIGIGWNSRSGWNVGVGVGLGIGGGFGNFGYCPPIYNPWNPWNPYNTFGGYGGFGWGDPFFNGYNPYNPYGRPAFWNGYNQGFANGYYRGGNNNFNNGGESRTSNRRVYNTPRGDRGSRNYINNDGSNVRPSRPDGNQKSGATQKNINTTTPTQYARPSRPTRPTSPTEKSVNTVPQNQPRSTPQRYQNNTTPRTYQNQQQRRDRPTTTTTPKPATPTQKKPVYTQPQRQNNTYNNTDRKPRTQPRTQPQRQSRPAVNRSRPSYNRSTPSYTPTPSRSGGGGSRSTPSRPSRPSRR